jgi:hypothetical protein
VKKSSRQVTILKRHEKTHGGISEKKDKNKALARQKKAQFQADGQQHPQIAQVCFFRHA